ncbi:hypothetical protein JCM8115_004771 [Rhodotorula mucilaginosa]|uniref:Proteasome maturation factor UMP1 n=1 Tax=Rhodotorula mucilaginosa TaxID=5537 RepID=A0A9P7B1L7_RHOMI|nr:hypothetical protein C6P46_002771 [Rhodotorula mucilaginosa]TKA52529.1 hypothetical protein B0A53_04905 [Rhodotorula sp. CCFEE 5036]
MEPSLHLVPSQQPTASHVSLADTASSLGPHDALAHGGPRSIASEVANKHPLQNRLAQWDATRENLHLTLERNMYGLHAPVRLEMERQLVGAAPTPLSLGLPGSGFTRPGNLGLDILTGRDEEIRPEDVLIDRVHTAPPADFHRTMERKLRIA